MNLYTTEPYLTEPVDDDPGSSILKFGNAMRGVRVDRLRDDTIEWMEEEHMKNRALGRESPQVSFRCYNLRYNRAHVGADAILARN